MPPGAVPLRKQQIQAFDAFQRYAAAGGHTGLIALATGGGKTLLATRIAREFERTLFVVNRSELIYQTQAAFTRMSPEIPQGLCWRNQQDLSKPITIGMINTIANRLGQIPADAFDLVVIDEAHHSSAATWRSVIEHFSPARFQLGLSATPERSDGASLADIFDAIIFEAGIRELVASGDLVRPVALQVSSGVNLDAVRKAAGDLNEGDLARMVDTASRNNLILKAYLEHAVGRQTIVFSAGVAHAQHLTELFCKAGVRAAWISGADADRREKLLALKRGEIDVIVNAMLLLEGFDHTSIGAVVMARPTSSRTVFTQAVGRGLRSHPGKKDCLIIDVCDTTAKHRLVNVWQFWGTEKPPEDGATDLIDHELMLEARAASIKDKSQQDQVDISANFLEAIGANVNLQAYLDAVDLLSPAPEVPGNKWAHLGQLEWHRQPPSEKQLAVLNEHGYTPDSASFTRGSASQIIDSLPPTPRQRQLLLAYGYDSMRGAWTRAHATLALEQAQTGGLQPDWTKLERLRGRKFPERKTPRVMQAV